MLGLRIYIQWMLVTLPIVNSTVIVLMLPRVSFIFKIVNVSLAFFFFLIGRNGTWYDCFVHCIQC